MSRAAHGPWQPPCMVPAALPPAHPPSHSSCGQAAGSAALWDGGGGITPEEGDSACHWARGCVDRNDEQFRVT